MLVPMKHISPNNALHLTRYRSNLVNFNGNQQINSSSNHIEDGYKKTINIT